MSESLKRYYVNNKHVMYGKHHSEEYRKKISELNKGPKNPNFGNKWSEEAKKKSSESKKRYYVTDN